MDRKIVLDHLALAEQHVLQGYAAIERQRTVIEDFERRGDHTNRDEAERLLMQFEATQSTFVDDRDRLRKELAEISN